MISHNEPLNRIKKWVGMVVIFMLNMVRPMKYYTYKYPFFHSADLLFYPGEVFKRKMEAINPNLKMDC